MARALLAANKRKAASRRPEKTDVRARVATVIFLGHIKRLTVVQLPLLLLFKITLNSHE